MHLLAELVAFWESFYQIRCDSPDPPREQAAPRPRVMWKP